jgi:hypothetical protein
MQKKQAVSSKRSKYIFVTGGVTSSLGKGIISASLAKPVSYTHSDAADEAPHV